MKPEQAQELKREVEKLRRLVGYLMRGDRFRFERDLDLADLVNIRIDGKTGTKIGTAATQKLALYGKTPIVQQSAISAPSTPSGVYSQSEAQSAVNAINSLRTALINF